MYCQIFYTNNQTSYSLQWYSGQNQFKISISEGNTAEENNTFSDELFSFFVDNKQCNESTIEAAIQQKDTSELKSTVKDFWLNHRNTRIDFRLPETLSGIGFINHLDYFGPLKSNLIFYPEIHESRSFDSSFITQFPGKEEKEAFLEFSNRIEQVLVENVQQTIITSDAGIFEEYLEVTRDSTSYFGFVDNETPEIPQLIFTIPTSVLSQILNVFVHRFITK